MRDNTQAGEPFLTQTRRQWQLGEWEALTALTETDIESETSRDRLALLIGTAWQQLGDQQQARKHIELALEWGCNRGRAARFLIAGVHNTLGKAAALHSQGSRALEHFRQAVDPVAGDKGLACRERGIRELTRLGILPGPHAGREAGSKESADPAGSPVFAEWNNDFPWDQQISGSTSDIERLVDACLKIEDVHAAIDAHAEILDAESRFVFYCGLAKRFWEKKDNLTAQHYLSCARELASEVDHIGRSNLARLYLDIGKSDTAVAIILDGALDESPLTESERIRIRAAAPPQGEKSSSAEHGHALLIQGIPQVLPAVRDTLGTERKPVLIEIGSTREDVPGQGSTRKLADLCAKEYLHFITVDMDPHNTAMARQTFDKMGAPFEAVTAKGEDFLRDYSGSMDFVFLDAYDFDHGKHSELRQSRYRQFLGNEINDDACHQMHLECAEAVAGKLSPHGLVCVDDTWQEDGKWTAKGTLAVPYLLQHGFEIADERNRAALLRRK